MEELVNCNLVMNIDFIEKIEGGNQFYEIFISSDNDKKYKIVFDFVWDMWCSIENAYIDRATEFIHSEREPSSILIILNSKYVKYFEQQSSGTRPIDQLKNYILYDSVDTVVEILSIKEPELVQL